MDDFTLLSDFSDGTDVLEPSEPEIPVIDNDAVDFPIDVLPSDDNVLPVPEEPMVTPVPDIEPTVTPVPVIPEPDPVPVTEYNLDDIYASLAQIDKNQQDIVAIGKQQVSLLILQVVFICVTAGLLLARIVWRKI